MTRWGIAIISLAWLASTAVAVTHHVPDGHPTIQAAVNAAAPGDTVAVAAGTYTEQVVVQVALVLLGAGRDQTVIQAPLDLPHEVGLDQYRAIVSIEDPAGMATVRDLTIDGLGRNPSGGRFVGLLYYRTGGTMSGLAVRNIHHSPVTSADSGVAVLAHLDQPTVLTDLTVTDVVIERFQKAGLVVSGTDYDLTVTGVDIDSDTIESDSVQNGIELTRVGHAVVTGCNVTGVTYDGTPRPQYTACGLLANGTAALELTASTFTGCQSGVYLVRTPSLVADVTVATPDAGNTTAHGLVSVCAINLDHALGTPEAVPAPRPFLTGVYQPTRPPVGFDVHVQDCTLEGGDLAVGRGLAVRAFTAEAQWLTAERCLITGWGRGVLSLEDQAEFGAVYARLSGCRLTDNLEYGIQAMTVTPLDARGCRWFGTDGPYHPELNPGGSGDLVSDNVRFDPWLLGNLAPLPLPQSISLQDLDGLAYTDTVSVEYLGGAEDLLYGFSAQITWDPAVVTSVTIDQPSRGGFAEAQIFQILPTDGGTTVDAALGGSGAGIGSGPLFTIRFEAVGTPDWTSSPLQLDLHHARNNLNQEIGGFQTDTGQVIVDLQPPVITSVILVNETLDHTDEWAKDNDLVSVTATITDADPYFDRGGIRGIGAFVYGAPSLILPPDEYDEGVATWYPRPALISPNPDGWQLFSVEAIDLSGNATTPLVSDSLYADNTPPDATSGVAAAAGHNIVDLAWDDATGNDANYRRTVVRANGWQGYPEYAGDPPAYPDDPDLGSEVYSGDGTATQLVYAGDGSERDMIYLTVMAEDMAGNLGPVDTGARARTVNYRLGDVRSVAPGSPGDGTVDIFDITRLGDTYTLLAGETGFDAECDLAPLDQDTVGVPVPDGVVDFTDLMVFAKAFEADLPGKADADAAITADLRWLRTAPDTWSLVLAAPCPSLQGLHLVGDACGVELRLEAGDLLTAQPGPWFLHHGRGACEVHLALLGHGVGMTGAGELVRLVADGPVELPAPTVELRDTANRTLDSALAIDDDTAPDLPTAFRASLPHPNPFNPQTTIAFDLPVGQDVTLTVYGLDGRRVRRVLAGLLPAGRHTARWDGRDQSGRPVASGTYLYRLAAGPWSAVGKLELIK